MGTKQRDRTLENAQAEMERRRREAPEWRARARGERGETMEEAAADQRQPDCRGRAPDPSTGA